MFLSLLTKNALRSTVLALGLLALAAAPASAAVADAWTRAGGSFRKVAPGVWHEYAGGKKIFEFREFSRTDKEIKLRDDSRNINVLLTEKEAVVYKDGKYLLNYTGRFVFTVFGYAGGEFRFIAAGRWEEWAGGKMIYAFREVGMETKDVVRLHDASRDISVEIYNTQFVVSRAGDMLFSKAGSWVR